VKSRVNSFTICFTKTDRNAGNINIYIVLSNILLVLLIVLLIAVVVVVIVMVVVDVVVVLLFFTKYKIVIHIS